MRESLIRVLIAATLGAALLVIGLATWASAQSVAVPLSLSVTPPAPGHPPRWVTAMRPDGAYYSCLMPTK